MTFKDPLQPKLFYDFMLSVINPTILLLQEWYWCCTSHIKMSTPVDEFNTFYFKCYAVSSKQIWKKFRVLFTWLTVSVKHNNILLHFCITAQINFYHDYSFIVSGTVQTRKTTLAPQSSLICENCICYIIIR